MSLARNIKLTKYEWQYINIIGKRFGVQGRSEVMGQIFALLNLRAPTPETAMSQRMISKLLDSSISTVSRTLKKLSKGDYCSYILEVNEEERSERRYHAIYDYKDFILARFRKTLKEPDPLVDDLKHLSQSIPNNKANENKHLLEQIDRYIEQTKMATKIIERLRKDLKGDIDSR